MKKLSLVLSFGISILFLFLTQSYSYATVSLIASTKATVTGTTVTTSAIDTTGANFVIVGTAALSPGDGGGSCTISDSKSNTWVGLTPTDGFFGRTKMFFVGNATVGSGHTFTITCTLANAPSMMVAAFSHVFAGGNPSDQEGAGAFKGATDPATIQPGSVTPSQNNELVVSTLGLFQVTTVISINSGFTIAQTLDGNLTTFTGSLAYLVQGTAGAINPTWNYTIQSNSEAVIATFKDDGTVTTSSGVMGGGVRLAGGAKIK